MDLLDTFRRSKGKKPELRRDASSPDGLLYTVAAYANTVGATIRLGVDDGAHLAAPVACRPIREVGTGPQDPERRDFSTEFA